METTEVVELLEQLLSILHDCPDVGPEMEADVWAHLGVAMQSMDQMEAALEAYNKAVLLNPRLHACYANLAVLHSYLESHTLAKQLMDTALAVEPENAAYLEISVVGGARGAQKIITLLKIRFWPPAKN